MLTRTELNDVASLFSEGIEPEPAPAPATRRRRRLETLRESVPHGVRRFIIVLFNVLRRRQVASLPTTLDLMLRDRLTRAGALPDPRNALPGNSGLVGLAPDLSPATMIEAYSRGLAPTAALGPIAWHSPPNPLIAEPAALAQCPKLAADRARLLITFDRDVDAVLANSANRSDGASLCPERLATAFADLFDAGYAHTFEARDATGRLIAGGYGVAVGRIFVLERVFGRRPEAVKAGLCRLAQFLRDWDFALVACGAGAVSLCGGSFEPTSRDAYLGALAELTRGDRVGRWPSDGGRRPALRLATARAA